MKKIVFLLLFLFSVPSFAEEPIGLVVDATGDVVIAQKGQNPVFPTLRQSVYLGDAIETKKTGNLKILFKDDTVLTVKENSKTLISEYLFDSTKSERKVVFDVIYGKVRSVVGRFFGEDQPVQIKTPTAVGGIRGTDVAALVTKRKTDFYCFDGILYVANKGSPQEEIQVKKGTFTEVFEDRLPTAISPIPQDVLQNNNVIFDISLTSGGAAKGSVAVAGGQGQSSQLSELAKSSVASDAIQTSSPVVAAQEAETAPTSLFDAASSASATVTSVVSAAPTAASDLGVQVLAGGAAEATNPITITIDLPHD